MVELLIVSFDPEALVIPPPTEVNATEFSVITTRSRFKVAPLFKIPPPLSDAKPSRYFQICYSNADPGNRDIKNPVTDFISVDKDPGSAVTRTRPAQGGILPDIQVTCFRIIFRRAGNRQCINFPAGMMMVSAPLPAAQPPKALFVFAATIASRKEQNPVFTLYSSGANSDPFGVGEPYHSPCMNRSGRRHECECQ